MRTTIYGKDFTSNRTFHIDEVFKKLKQTFMCNECGSSLIPVKTDARGKDWHFRHAANSDLNKCRQTGLHDFVQQLLLDNSLITIAKGRRIEFTERKKEQWLERLFRSDVSGLFENILLHFEIVVTHDLSDEKLNYLIRNKIRFVRIDLSDKKYLNMPRDIIANLVLNNWENKTLYGWEEININETEIIQGIIPVAEIIAQPKAPLLITNHTHKDPVITFLKWCLLALLAFVIYRIFFKSKSSYVTINQRSKNRFRRR